MAVEYPIRLMRDLAYETLEGHLSFPAGGREVGGVLYGKHARGQVHIRAARPVECEYAAGPSYLLSPLDESRLQESLAAVKNEKALKGLTPVGWYLSHNRSPLPLRDQDREIFTRYFPDSWQVTLVLKPAASGEVRATFFDHETIDGAAREEFDVLEAPEASAFGPASGQRPPAELLDLPEPSARRRSRLRWILPAGALLLLLTAVALRLWYFGPPRAPLQLHVVRLESSRLTLRWDATSAFVMNARRAELLVTDGAEEIRSGVDAEVLRSGSLPILASSGDVRARLSVYPSFPGRGPEPVEEATRFLARAARARSEDDETTPEDEESLRLRIEADELRTQLSGRREENQTLAERLETARAELDRRLAEEARKAPPVPAPRSEPAQAPPTPSAPAPKPPIFSGGSQAAARSGLPQPGLDPPAASGTGGATAPTAARSGRLIWTGYLPPTASLTIESGRASTGSLNGALPRKAVRVSAYPAELSSTGMTVFSNDSTLPREGAVEPPGPRNAWTRTQFVHDPARAANLSLVEAPAPENNWAELQLRAGRQPISVVIIEWVITE